MGKSEKQIEKEKARNQRIIDTAFQIFVCRIALTIDLS